MQTHFVFRHMESSDALRSYAEDRLSKVNRYFPDPLKVSCTFSVEKIHHAVHFDITLRNGLQLHASESTENMYSSIDLALAKMERQVRRYKDRISSHKAHKGRAAKMRQRVMEVPSFADMDAPMGGPEELGGGGILSDAPAEISSAPAIKRMREFKAERLTADQAVMQMDLLHKAFLVFTNVTTSDINIVYRNDEGDYVLIETHGHVDSSS